MMWRDAERQRWREMLVHKHVGLCRPTCYDVNPARSHAISCSCAQTLLMYWIVSQSTIVWLFSLHFVLCSTKKSLKTVLWDTTHRWITFVRMSAIWRDTALYVKPCTFQKWYRFNRLIAFKFKSGRCTVIHTHTHRLCWGSRCGTSGSEEMLRFSNLLQVVTGQRRC